MHRLLRSKYKASLRPAVRFDQLFTATASLDMNLITIKR